MKKLLIPIAALLVSLASANAQAPAAVSKQKKTSTTQPVASPGHQNAPAAKALTPAAEIHATPKPVSVSDKKEPENKVGEKKPVSAHPTKAVTKTRKTAPANVTTGKTVQPREGSHGKSTAPAVKQNPVPDQPMVPKSDNKK